MNRAQNLSKAAVFVSLSAASLAVSAQDVSVCQGTLDNTERLACYDRIFGTTATVLTDTATNHSETAVEVLSLIHI